jgi:hypothetical protein
MRHAVLHSHPSLRSVLAALGLAFSTACGGGGEVTQPIIPVVPPAPGVLVASSDTVRAQEFLTLRPSGLGRAVPDTVTGRLGSVDFRAMRLNDSTLVALAPAGLSGPQTATFSIGGRSFTVQLVLKPEIVVADPSATAASLFARATARFDSIEAAMPASAALGMDTTTTRRAITAGRAAVAQGRQDFLALDANERREAIRYIVAAAASLGLEASVPASSSRSSASVISVGTPDRGLLAVCTRLSTFEACSNLNAVGTAIGAGVRATARCAANTGLAAAVGAGAGIVIGGGLSFIGSAGAATIPGAAVGMKVGASIGALLGVAWCASDVLDSVSGTVDAAVAPTLTEVVDESSQTRLVAGDARGRGLQPSRLAATSATASVFTSGVARPVGVYVDFRSLSTADASGPAPVAHLVRQYGTLTSAWESIRTQFPSLNLPSLALPATPRVTVRKRVPASYLTVTAVSPSPITGVATGTDTTWKLTFTNAQAGDDHDFAYTVRFSYPGFPDQDRARTAMLRPARYTVAGIDVTPAVDTVMVGKSAGLTWAAKDSSGDVLTDSLLAGRSPTWSTSSAAVATVGATGSVSGVAVGTATITAALETGRGTSTMLVFPDITGTYTLKQENGVVIPGIVFEDSIYRIRTTSGSVTLRADGTFGFVRAAIGTNLKTNVSYDEGGSGGGTYVINAGGAAIQFTTTEQAGVPLTFGTGFVDGKTLTISVVTPDGAGSAVLVKP